MFSVSALSRDKLAILKQIFKITEEHRCKAKYTVPEARRASKFIWFIVSQGDNDMSI